MEVQLAELIEKIKAEGIGAAEAEATRIVGDAKAKAAALLAGAEAEAEGLRAKARADAAREEEAGKAALVQAARNLVLGFKDSLAAMLAALAADQAGKALDPALLGKLIPQAAKSLAAGEGLEISLSPKDLEALGDHFSAALAKELGKGVVLRASAAVGAGFRISAKGGSYSYDYTAGEFSAMMAQYLSPRLRAILDAAVKG